MKEMNVEQMTERSGLILDETDLDGKPLLATADDSDGTDGVEDADGTDSEDADGTDGDSTDSDGTDGDGSDGDSAKK